jgi:hypothetical protein
MSLAFALMAAINGSTGSSARLSFGLNGTKPQRRQSDGIRILTAQRRRREPSETLSCESPSCGLVFGRVGWPGCAPAVDGCLWVRSGGLFCGFGLLERDGVAERFELAL